jgi:hypothetical protein
VFVLDKLLQGKSDTCDEGQEPVMIRNFEVNLLTDISNNLPFVLKLFCLQVNESY